MDAETDRRKSGVYRHRETRMMSDTVSVGDAIRRAVRGLGIESRLKEQRVLSLWPEVVGEDVAAVAQANEFRSDGQLVVSVDNSTWRHWLTFQRNTIIQNLNEAAGGEVVRSIRLE